MYARLKRYFILLVWLVLATAMAMALVDRTPEEIKATCEKACIVPDVLPFAPKHIVKVKYFHGFIANLGNKLITNDIHIIPNIMDWPVKSNKFYTIVFVGPDEPSAAAAYNSQVVYWLKANIFEHRYSTTGDTIVEYASPVPLEGTSWHRYVYVVYEQPHGRMEVKMQPIMSNSTLEPARANFSTQAFAKTQELGDAHAVNFFVFEWRDDFFEPLNLTIEKSPTPDESEFGLFLITSQPTTLIARP